LNTIQQRFIKKYSKNIYFQEIFKLLIVFFPDKVRLKKKIMLLTLEKGIFYFYKGLFLFDNLKQPPIAELPSHK